MAGPCVITSWAGLALGLCFFAAAVTVVHGLQLRLGFLGPLETSDPNARQVCRRFLLSIFVICLLFIYFDDSPIEPWLNLGPDLNVM